MRNGLVKEGVLKEGVLKEGVLKEGLLKGGRVKEGRVKEGGSASWRAARELRILDARPFLQRAFPPSARIAFPRCRVKSA